MLDCQRSCWAFLNYFRAQILTHSICDSVRRTFVKHPHALACFYEHVKQFKLHLQVLAVAPQF